MISLKQHLEEKEVFRKAIRYVEKEYGKKVCKDIMLGCPNCSSQILMGLLKEHLDLLEWELKEFNNGKKK